MGAPAISNPDPQQIEGGEGADDMQGIKAARNSSLNLEEETVSPLTSAQCLAIAERKIVEAMGDGRYGKELKLTAQAWMVLAEKVRQGEALQKQADALKIAKLAPDIASTAASAQCGFLKKIADDIRSFQVEALEAQRRLPPTESDLSSRHHVSVACVAPASG